MSGPEPRQSPLEKHPAHVQALGMIAIELANLEVVFSNMLGAVLRLDLKTAKALYFTPKSSQARMETLVNVIDEVLKDTPFLTICDSFVKRGLRILNKRNGMLHDVWGVSKDDQNQVVALSFPGGERKPIQLAILTNMIRDLRILADEVMSIFTPLTLRPHYRINVTYKSPPEMPD
jgi:hypothetical protein